MSGWQAVQWVAILPALWVTISQWLRHDGDRYTAALQALYPLLVIPVAVVLPTSLASDHLAISATAGAILITFAFVAAPLVRGLLRRRTAPDRPGVPTVRICVANVLAWNTTMSATAAAIAKTDADLVVLAEPTHALARHVNDLVGERYPHRIEVLADDTTGVALWSRLPVVGEVVVFEQQRWVDAIVVIDRVDVRVIAAHPYPPTMHAAAWQRQLRWLAERVQPQVGPIVVAGDFNACRWHPSFRRLLRATSLAGAHELLGHPLSTSWPAHIAERIATHTGSRRLARLARLARFVRLDHALVSKGIVPTSIEEIDLPGSDHTGFVLSVRVTPAPTQ